MATGKIEWFNGNYGIIKNKVDGKDIFLHKSQVSSKDVVFLDKGTEVEFDIQASEIKPGRLDASNCRLSESLPSQTHTPSPSQETGESKSSPGKEFHNPYTFVPTPPRPSCGFAGDFNPLERDLDHASLKDRLWTGHIPIKLTTVTPLVLLKGDGRKEYSTEEPYDVYDHIPESSLRGMLRSAYEVVTNSRYGCFKNSDRLAYRMQTEKAQNLIPAIIENGNKEGELIARFCVGSSDPTTEGPKKGGTYQDSAMYAAMMTLYPKPEHRKLRTKCPSNYSPKTGDEVWAEVVLCQHESSKRRSKNWSQDYLFWKVVQVLAKSEEF